MLIESVQSWNRFRMPRKKSGVKKFPSLRMLLTCVLTWVAAGLPQKGYVTTALDLALIIKAALQTAEFRRIVAKKDYPWSYFWQPEKSSAVLTQHRV